MEFRRGPLGRKARILLACGCFCLALGTGLGAHFHPPAGAASDWFDGVRGLLLGLAIGLNLAAVLTGKGNCGNRTNSVEGA
jgi:hypothetical protein